MKKARFQVQIKNSSSLLDMACAFSVSMLLLQAFRNYSDIYIGLLLTSIVLLLFVSLYFSDFKFRVANKKTQTIYFIFIFYTTYVLFWSYLYGPEISIINSAGRLFFSTLIPLIFIFVKLDDKRLLLFFRVYTLIYVLGAFSYFYQFIYGPINWFVDEPMERGTLFRFSTILGSGNIYGIGVGVALLLVGYAYSSRFVKLFFYVTLLSGAFMSLQKAAVINIVLWALFILYQSKFKEIWIYILGIFILISATYSLGLVYYEHFLSQYLQEFVFNSIGLNLYSNPDLVRSTILDKENMIERFVGINLAEIFGMHNPIIITFMGIGLMGAGGGMGLPEFPQAHSTYWDIFFMGGLGYLIIYLLLFISVHRNLRLINTKVSLALMAANAIFFINSFSSSASVYHPVLSFVFWVSVIFVIQASTVKSR